MLVPTSSSVYQEKLPDFAITIKQQEDIQKLYHNMHYAKTIDVTQAINEAKEFYLYFKTDHHMTSLGAYLLYTSFCEAKGTNPTPLTAFTEKVVSTSFLGTFDSKARVPGQVPDVITIYENEKNTNLKEVQYDTQTTQSIYNEAYLQQKDKYSFFLNGNNSKVVVRTYVQNGEKLLVIKDSYAHNTVQFLCQDYEEIHLIDPTYYHGSLSEYVKQQGITEILVLYNYSNLLTDIGIRGIY